jgi:hypothetical protein
MINRFRRICQQLRYSKPYQGAVKDANEFSKHPSDIDREVLLVVSAIPFAIATHTSFRLNL